MQSWPMPETVRSVNVDGYPIAYQEKGERTPVLLIHGSLNDYRSWINQADAFAKHHRIFAISLRHYFPERWDGRGGDFSLAQHAADCAAFTSALGLGKVHIVGHSRGGSVAYLLARDHPQLVRSLVLAEPRGLEDLLPEGAANTDGSKGMEEMFRALHEAVREGRPVDAAKGFVDALNGPGAWDAMPERQRGIILDNLATAAEPGELPGMRCEDIARFDFPVLPVRGEKSPQRYALGLQAMRGCNPKINPVAVIPGASHGMHRTHPQAFNEVVLHFLAAV